MLRRTNRLRASEDIQAVIRQGQKIYTPHVTVFLNKRADGNPSRMAVVVGKRVSPSAVRRHRLQRLLRQIARSTLMLVPENYDIVWLGKPSLAQVLSLAELSDSIQPHLQNIKNR